MSETSMVHENLTSANSFKYVTQFRCLQNDCENTCCEGWEIAVSNEEADQYQQNVPHVYEVLARENGVYKLPISDTKPCGFLVGEKCGIQLERGEQQLPDACHVYPRMYRHINNALLESATISCPEIARLCLYGDSPFTRARSTLTRLPQLSQRSVERVKPQTIVAIVDKFIETALGENHSAEHSLLNILYSAYHLDQLACENWSEQIDSIFERAHGYACAQGHQPIDDHTHPFNILIEMLSTHHLPKTVLDKVYGSIETCAQKNAEQPLLLISKKRVNAYQGETYNNINHVLKRYVAAEITRTGFPFISETPAGKWYGETLKHWAFSLTVRFVCVRLLLLCHIDEQDNAPDEKTVVELLHRLSRNINHHPPGVVETTFYNKTEGDFLSIAKNLVLISSKK